jgi:hypothetical protein
MSNDVIDIEQLGWHIVARGAKTFRIKLRISLSD